MIEVVRTMDKFIQEGKILYWGTSEWTNKQITECLLICQFHNLICPIVEQSQYNMFHRDKVEKEMLNFLSYPHHNPTTMILSDHDIYSQMINNPIYKIGFGIGLVVWSPLGSGILTGKYNPTPNHKDKVTVPAGSRLSRDDNVVTKRMKDWLLTNDGLLKIDKVKQLSSIAKDLGATMAQLAIAWCLLNPNVSSVIMGATNPGQIEENCKAIQIYKKLMADKEARIKVERILGNGVQQDIVFRNT